MSLVSVRACMFVLVRARVLLCLSLFFSFFNKNTQLFVEPQCSYNIFLILSLELFLNYS